MMGREKRREYVCAYRQEKQQATLREPFKFFVLYLIRAIRVTKCEMEWKMNCKNTTKKK